MSANRSSLDRFIKKLPDFFAADVIRKEKVRLSGRAETNWDMPARQVMKQKFDAWLKEELDLSAAELDQTLFVEGLFGDLPARTRAEFFGSQCCPDMALKSNDGYTIAVELDHGSSGSSLRNALTKASFNVIVGGFDPRKPTPTNRRISQAWPCTWDPCVYLRNPEMGMGACRVW